MTVFIIVYNIKDGNVVPLSLLNNEDSNYVCHGLSTNTATFCLTIRTKLECQCLTNVEIAAHPCLSARAGGRWCRADTWRAGTRSKADTDGTSGTAPRAATATRPVCPGTAAKCLKIYFIR